MTDPKKPLVDEQKPPTPPTPPIPPKKKWHKRLAAFVSNAGEALGEALFGERR